MSVYSEWKTATIAINQTASGEVDLGQDYDFLQVILPTLTSGTLKVQVAQKSGGTFQDLAPGSGASATTPTTTGAHSDVWVLGGYRYIKIVSSASQGAARTITVRGGRY